MIKAPSLQSEYSLIFSGDPALILPEDPAERTRVLSVAQQTGNWAALVAPGQVPTVFHFRNLEHSDIAWLDGEFQSSTEHGRPLGQIEYLTLAVRLALKGVENFGTHKVEHKPLGSQRKVATPAIVNAIYAAAGKLGAELITEFAVHIINRGSGQLDPL